MAGEGPAATRARPRNSQDVALLDQKLGLMGESLDDLKGMVKDLADKVGNLEKKEISCQASIQFRVDLAHSRLDAQAEQLKILEGWKSQASEFLTRLNTAYGILVFVASAFGVSIIALIWALVTGQAVVVVK